MLRSRDTRPSTPPRPRSAPPSRQASQPAVGPPLDLSVERARRGDVGAFEDLYRRHVGRVYALCRRLCGDPQEAEEATQDAFVRAWESLDGFRGDSAFGTWLHRLTVNTVLGRWRAAGRYRDRVLPIDDLIRPAAREAQGSRDGGSRDGGPGDAFDAVEHLAPASRPRDGLRIDLERAIDALPPGARTVFVLHDIEGLRHRDIAERTGLAVGTSKTQLHRARRLLRRALDGSPATGKSSR